MAWGFGSGLPRSVWARVASAVSGEGAAYEISDVNEVLRRAGSHIVETEEDGQSVYRLGHELGFVEDEERCDQGSSGDHCGRVALGLAVGGAPQRVPCPAASTSSPPS